MVVWVQTRLLESDELFSKDFGRGHACEGGRCDIRCLNAVHERCVCRCKGRNHGLMHKRRNISLDDSKLYFSLTHDPLIRKMFDGKRCLSCGETLDYAEILAYEHEGGIYYEPYKMKLWVFAECPRCRYQNTLKQIREVVVVWPG